jgi:tetratricopeptide (TPR) repeat protein
LNCQAQTTKLTYKVKGKTTYAVDVIFASENGKESLQPDEYFSYTDIYFILKPSVGSSRSYFKEKDIENILTKVTLVQSQDINQSSKPRYLLNGKNKVNRIIIAFPKTNFIGYKKFSFNAGVFFSDKVELKEQFRPSHKKYSELFENAKSQLSAEAYLLAFNNFMTIATDGIKNKEISSFSFYETVVNQFLSESIDIFIKLSKEKMEKVSTAFEENKNYSSLRQCKNTAEGIMLEAKTFAAFNDFDTDIAKNANKKLTDFLTYVKTESLKKIKVFEAEKMVFFEKKNYSDYKFKVFTDLICRVLLYKDSMSFVNKLEPIDVERINKFPEIKKELMNGWETDLQIYFELINQNIQKNGKVFNPVIMDNLNELLTSQRQPYFEIFAAFNALKSNPEESRSYFHAALTKCSDEKMLDHIEYWLLSYRMADNNIDPGFLSQINDGTKLIYKKRYNQADNVFNQLIRIASDFAPTWYYSGEIKYYLGESYSAERFFNKALEIYPHYIAPRKFILRIFENDSSYKQYFENANLALEKFDIWYFHFNKAKALYYLGKYEETIAEINTNCLTKNSWDLNQYYLLGDAYFKKNDFENSKKAYGKILDINPFLTDTKKFDKRMRKVSEKMEKQ